jgi:agmatine/peptidylarginine deiminase
VRPHPLTAALVFTATGAPALAQTLGPDGLLHYDPGTSYPRSLTATERDYLRSHPLSQNPARTVTPPPTGPIHCAAEYEPMEAIIITWVGGQTTIQSQLARWITTTGNADLWIVVPTGTNTASISSTLSSAGANTARVHYLPAPIDTVWCRDYGPRYIFEGDCRAIVDHQYNRPRPNDDNMPFVYGAARHHTVYSLGLGSTELIHGGGNFHLDALSRSYATRLTVNENPSFTESQIVGIWGTYQGVQHTFFDPFPTTIDSTQHLDMWMQVIADDKVIISDWPNNAGSTQDLICDGAVTTMQSRGYTVYRTNSYSIGGVHYTYTNMVMCNDVVMVPSYTNATVAPNNAAVVATLQAALPSKTIVQINCDSIIGLAGAIHCIVMHVPKHRGLPGTGGGLAPTAYVKSPNGGEVFTPGAVVNITWLSDDDVGVSNVDILLSTDGGQTYPTTIAAATADTGSFAWTVPGITTNRARIKVVARDGDGNTGGDASDADFKIGNPCYANCDDSTSQPVLNVGDFTCFLQAFAAGDSYANCDGSTSPPVLNVADFTCFLQKFAAGCP